MRKLFAIVGAACIVACGTALTIAPDDTSGDGPDGAPGVDGPVDAVVERSAGDEGGEGGGDGGADASDGCTLVVADDFDKPTVDLVKWEVMQFGCTGAAITPEGHVTGSALSFLCSGGTEYNLIQSNATTPYMRRTEVDFEFKLAAVGNHLFAVVINGLGSYRGLAFGARMVAPDQVAVSLVSIDARKPNEASSPLLTWPTIGIGGWHTAHLTVTPQNSTELTATVDGIVKKYSVTDAGPQDLIRFWFGIDRNNGDPVSTSIDTVHIDSCPP